MKARTFLIAASAAARRSGRALLLVALLLPSADGRQARSPASIYDPLIASAAERHRLDRHVLRALIRHESGFQPCATSPKGARGLMQLMPATAARFGVKNVCHPAENIEGGARYLRWLLDYFGGDYALALAGYNAGEGAVMKYGRRVPPYAETMNYVSSVRRTATIYRAAAGHTPSAPARPAPAPNGVPARPKPETASAYFWD